MRIDIRKKLQKSTIMDKQQLGMKIDNHLIMKYFFLQSKKSFSNYP